MPADVSIRFRAESQQARKEVQILRGTLTQLNKTLVRESESADCCDIDRRRAVKDIQARA